MPVIKMPLAGSFSIERVGELVEILKLIGAFLGNEHSPLVYKTRQTAALSLSNRYGGWSLKL